MRHPSIRGLGIRYLIAVLLPISGIILVVYTVVQLAIAEATHTVPPPRRIAEAMLSQDFRPPVEGDDARFGRVLDTPGARREEAPASAGGTHSQEGPAPGPAPR